MSPRAPWTPVAARAAVDRLKTVDTVACERLVRDLCDLHPATIVGLVEQYMESRRLAELQHPAGKGLS